MRSAELERAWMKKLEDVAHMVMLIDAEGGCKGLQGGHLVSIKVLLPTEQRGDCLLVLKASTSEGGYVGFVGGADFATTLLAWRKKENAAGVSFREDTPYTPG